MFSPGLDPMDEPHFVKWCLYLNNGQKLFLDLISKRKKHCTSLTVKTYL